MTIEKLLYRLEQPHGPGDIYICWQKGSGTYLATTGCDATVSIFDRYGQSRTRIKLPGLCSGFGWDMDGDVLAIISSTSAQLMLWDANTGRQQNIDIGLRDALSCLFWAKTGAVLAIATTRGNLAIYNHNTSKRIPVIGKHSKRITCGSWNAENLLALGSEDKSVSISNADGDTLRIIPVRNEPAEIQFSEMKGDERIGGENTVSMIVGKRTLYLYNLLDPDNPIELAFQSHYGSIITYKWYGDGYILIGFSAGYFISISTHIKEVGQELFQVKNHQNSLNDVALSLKLGKVASCGDNVIKVHELFNLPSSNSITLEEEVEVERASWSEDGQLLAVCGRSGSINLYLARVSVLSATSGLRIALLSGLVDVAIHQYNPDKVKTPPIIVSTEVEPSFLALGPYHLACGMNNRAWLYDLTRPQPGSGDSAPLLVRDREYLSAVHSMRINAEYVSVLCDGKLQLHMIEQPDVANELKDTKMFPETNKQDSVITDHALTTDFLIYSTDKGHIIYFYMEDWKTAIEFHHEFGIKNIFVDLSGTRIIFIDEKVCGYLYNPVLEDIIKIPDFVSASIGAVWDSFEADRNVFITFDDSEIITYIYIKNSIKGTYIQKIGTTKIINQQIPLLLFGGELTLMASSGQLTQLTLTTHELSTISLRDRDKASLEQMLAKHLLLHRYQDVWDTCEVLDKRESWSNFAEMALTNLEIEWAIRVYRHLEDVSMVWALEKVSDIDNWQELAGHAALLLGDMEEAQNWFVKSGNPKIALDMRKDLLNWDEALQLANKYAPEDIPNIAREYAQQLEFSGNYPEALTHYERGLQNVSNDDVANNNHVSICEAGIARTALRCGNIRRGFTLALNSDNSQLQKECAEILETKKQYSESAVLFEKCNSFDKAASVYIKLKNWQKVGELIANITSPKIHLQYAKAKENEGQYEEAVQAYQLAKDYDSVIRLQLNKLNNPEAAVELVQETKSIEGAKMVAWFFQNLNDYSSAIRFLVISHCFDEAFQMARKHKKLELYGEILVNMVDIEDARLDDFKSLALHFENERNYLLAGKYFFHSRDFEKAMKYLLRVAKSTNDDNDALSLAIDVVATSNSDSLKNQLIEFLLGETDGIPKDPKYLFRLYMAKKQYKEAAKTAIIIANEEQINGKYRNARDVLFSMFQELKRNQINIPIEMKNNLMLLHSYILGRLHVKKGNNLKAARMLIRAANNISKFPSHIVPILTSTVFACLRANLKKYAFKYATILMRSEYRSQIDLKYVKKIESVVRKPPKSADVDEEQVPSTPCPYCNNSIPETDMDCDQCKNNLPFCIASGYHIITSDLTACPQCDFPAIYSELLSLVNLDGICPICGEKIDPRQLRKIENTRPYLYINGEE